MEIFCRDLESEVEPHQHNTNHIEYVRLVQFRNIELLLLTPGIESANNRLLIEQVTKRNIKECFSHWKTDTQFNFRDTLQRYKLRPIEFSRRTGNDYMRNWEYAQSVGQL